MTQENLCVLGIRRDGGCSLSQSIVAINDGQIHYLQDVTKYFLESKINGSLVLPDESRTMIDCDTGRIVIGLGANFIRIPDDDTDMTRLYPSWLQTGKQRPTPHQTLNVSTRFVIMLTTRLCVCTCAGFSFSVFFK